MAGHLSAVIQLSDYATAAKRLLVRKEPECEWTELKPLHQAAKK